MSEAKEIKQMIDKVCRGDGNVSYDHIYQYCQDHPPLQSTIVDHLLLGMLSPSSKVRYHRLRLIAHFIDQQSGYDTLFFPQLQRMRDGCCKRDANPPPIAYSTKLKLHYGYLLKRWLHHYPTYQSTLQSYYDNAMKILQSTVSPQLLVEYEKEMDRIYPKPKKQDHKVKYILYQVEQSRDTFQDLYVTLQSLVSMAEACQPIDEVVKESLDDYSKEMNKLDALYQGWLDVIHPLPSSLGELQDRYQQIQEIKARMDEVGYQRGVRVEVADLFEELEEDSDDEVFEVDYGVEKLPMVLQEVEEDKEIDYVDIHHAEKVEEAVEEDIEAISNETREDLLKKAPVFEWDSMFEYWGEEKIPINPNRIHVDNAFVADREEAVIDRQLLPDYFTREVIKTGTRRWKVGEGCKVKMKNGMICGRKDVKGCPIHQKKASNIDEGTAKRRKRQFKDMKRKIKRV